jgi:hypothetical protein
MAWPLGLEGIRSPPPEGAARHGAIRAITAMSIRAPAQHRPRIVG